MRLSPTCPTKDLGGSRESTRPRYPAALPFSLRYYPRMDPQTLLLGAVTVLVGALSGGITNAVAIWMLFHPYERRGWGPFRLHGAIPKNKPRLAKSIGRTVGEKLLTAEDITRRMDAPEIREKFTGALDHILGDILEAERGPLEEHLDPKLMAAVREALASVGERVAVKLADYTRREEFAGQLQDWIAALKAEVGDNTVAEVLTEERRDALHQRVNQWVVQFAEGEELHDTLERFVHGQLDKLATDDRPLLDRLPPGLIGAVEQGITDYLPVALERIGAVLSDPDAKGRIQQALRDAFDRSVRDMLLHERIIAKFVVTDQTFKRLLDGLEKDGFERFASTMTAPEMRAQFSKAVNDAVVNFLRIPLGERIRRLGPDKRAGLEETLVDWLIRVTRDPGARAVIGRTLDKALGAAERRTWAEVVDLLPGDKIAGAVTSGIASAQGQRWIAQAVDGMIAGLIRRPLGRPANWLGPETTASVKAGIIDAAWRWTHEQVPRIVESFRIQDVVEQKVLGFSTERMEQIVRGVTGRELKLIVRLGYVLGAMVGLLAFAINLLANR